MELLVAGGTGFIGTALCRELDDRGHDVIAFSRSPETADLPAGVETVAGDVRDSDSVAAAVEGVDAVVNLVALSPLRRPSGGESAHDAVHRVGTEHLVEAAADAGVDRFLQQSAIHADPAAPTAYLRAKGRAEETVRASDVDAVILRPTTVFGDGDELTGFVRRVAPPYLTPLPGGGRTRFELIWVGDLAPVMADAIESDRHLGETYEIGGPDVLTLAELAALVHRADGRSTTVVPIPMAVAGLGMAVGQYVPGFPFGPDQYRGLQLDLITADNDVAAFGLDPDDLRRYADYLGVVG